jgi:GMC oxidoreductase
LIGAGKSIPTDIQSKDSWFQHFELVISNKDKVFTKLQRLALTGISSISHAICSSNQSVPDTKVYKFKDSDSHPLQVLYFLLGIGGLVCQGHVNLVFPGILKISVFGNYGKLHGLKNVHVIDGSALPRSSGVNPALTIYAWSLRVASMLT